MSLNGVWVLEVAGAFGWERVSTVFLEKGRYLGGGANFFSQGSYVKKGDKVKISLQVTRHGKEQVVLGERSKFFSAVINANVGKNEITGHVQPTDAHSSDAKYPARLLRQTDLISLTDKE